MKVTVDISNLENVVRLLEKLVVEMSGNIIGIKALAERIEKLSGPQDDAQEIKKTSIKQLEKSHLTIQEASAYIGLSVRTIRRMIDAGRFVPHRPTPGRILLNRDQIDNYLRTSVNGKSRRR